MSKMAKVIFLSGSPKIEGNTMQVMQECLPMVEQEGLETELISLSGKKIEACIACRKCAELKKCVLNDDLNEILEKVRVAEGFIIGAPVYFGTPRGDLMNAIQRIGMVSYGTDRFLSWKVGGPIAVGRRGGLCTTYQEMLMFYFINDMIVPGSNYWNIVFGKAAGEAMQDEEGLNTIKKFSANVAKLIKKINA